MEFSAIYTLALNTLHEASNYFTLRTMAQREQMQQQYAPQQRPTRPGNVMQDISPEAFNASQGKVPVTEAKKKKPEKSGGFLSRFRHKKDD